MNAEYSEESDSSDEDYVPPAGGPSETLSEVDSDGDPEDHGDDGKPSKQRKQQRKTNAKQQEQNVDETRDGTKPAVDMSAEEKKKHADDIWASFKKDTGFKKKAPNLQTNLDETAKTAPTPPKTMSITKVYEFAGEEVTIVKNVQADSAEARLAETPSSSPSAGAAKRRAGLGGIGAVLNQLGKKQKLSTLDKTKLDWNRFKQDQKIEDELESYRKGKNGYLDKQDFLERADMRRFEIEKEMRAVQRANRIN